MKINKKDTNILYSLLDITDQISRNATCKPSVAYMFYNDFNSVIYAATKLNGEVKISNGFLYLALDCDVSNVFIPIGYEIPQSKNEIMTQIDKLNVPCSFVGTTEFYIGLVALLIILFFVLITGIINIKMSLSIPHGGEDVKRIQ